MNRYSFTTKTKALNLIKKITLGMEDNLIPKIHGIKVWGFEYKQVPILDEDMQPTYDADGLPLVDIIKGTTYNVDVVWKGEQPTEWEQYEVFPNTPSHTIS